MLGNVFKLLRFLGPKIDGLVLREGETYPEICTPERKRVNLNRAMVFSLMKLLLVFSYLVKL